jgi:hypothetical protein
VGSGDAGEVDGSRGLRLQNCDLGFNRGRVVWPGNRGAGFPGLRAAGVPGNRAPVVVSVG